MSDEMYLINEIGKSNGQNVKICGWFKEYICDGLIIMDSTGELHVVINPMLTGLYFRDVISLWGVYDKDKKVFLANRIEVLNKNTYICENDLKDDIDSYLKNSYLYFNQMDRIEALKMINEIQKMSRDYFTQEYDFIEIQTPVFWTKVQEYGEGEWISVFSEGGEESYTLPQSPEIITLMNAIGGIQRNFTFGKCFRKEKEIYRNDSLTEFTQFIITAAYFDINCGKKMINNFLKALVGTLKFERSYELKTISYEDSLFYYGSDKPDLRYQKILTPIRRGMKDETYRCIIIPDDINENIIHVIENFIVKKLSSAKYEILKTKSSRYTGGSVIKQIKKNIELDYNLDMEYVLVIIEDIGNSTENVIRGFVKKLYPIIYGKPKDFVFTWIDKVPFIESLELSGAQHNIFSKVDQRVFDYHDSSEKYYTSNFDIVLNGVEIASGGVRERFKDAFINLMKYYNINDYEEKYNYYMNALSAGAPPIFLIAFGWERLLWILLDRKYIHEIVNFPKDGEGRCRITNAPRKY